jgi:hypothetical protein
MRKFLTLFAIILFNTPGSFGQISFTGTGTSTSTPVNAPAITVDNSISITSSLSITDARVTISSNFNSGDVLASTASVTGVTSSYNSATGVLSFAGTATAAQYQTLFRGVTFATSSTNASQRTILFELGDVNVKYNSANGHYYLYVSGSYNWSSAKTEAELASRKFFGLQGYLATVTTSSENSFVNGLSGKGWLGGSDDYNYINAATGTTTYAAQANSEGHWYWVTGPEKGTHFSDGSAAFGGAFTNWNSGEPNNSSSLEHYLENYYASGLWNDSQNGNNTGIIIEYGGIAGDPAVTTRYTRNITLIATSVRMAGTNNGYALYGGAIPVDNTLTVYSASNITNATVTISSGFKSGDVLSFTSANLPAGVTGSYNATTGVLSFTGSSASYSAWQALLRTVTFYSTSNVIGNRSISFSMGNLISGSNGHFYEFVTPAVNWATAKTNAASRTYLGLTGYLATITSQTENDFIQQKLSADGWVGASDEYSQINSATGASTYANQTASEGKWYWVTGPEKGTQFSNGNTPATQITYMNWNSGEPNNSSGEHYAQIYSSASTGKWNDLNGTQSLGYVVEYGGLASDPLLELSASRTIVITSILPANDLKFAAVKNGQSVELKWSTGSEKNTLRFDVMHSVNGREFNKVGEVTASQNSFSTRSYSFTHATPANGTNYYRLKLVDADGKTGFSDIRQLSFDKIGFAVSPNPVKASFTVSNPFGRNAVLVIKNAGGATVLKQDVGLYQSTVNVNQLAAGIYFVSITSGQQQSDVIRFVKE